MSKNDNQNRANYTRALAREWIRRNRPDVYEVIEREASGKYPKLRKAAIANFPKSLEKLK